MQITDCIYSFTNSDYIALEYVEKEAIECEYMTQSLRVHLPPVSNRHLRFFIEFGVASDAKKKIFNNYFSY